MAFLEMIYVNSLGMRIKSKDTVGVHDQYLTEKVFNFERFFEKNVQNLRACFEWY